jgi:hypothetical protein
MISLLVMYCAKRPLGIWNAPGQSKMHKLPPGSTRLTKEEGTVWEPEIEPI